MIYRKCTVIRIIMILDINFVYIYLESSEDNTDYEKSIRMLLNIEAIANKKEINIMEESSEGEVEESSENMDIKAAEIAEISEIWVKELGVERSGEGMQIIELSKEAEDNTNLIKALRDSESLYSELLELCEWKPLKNISLRESVKSSATVLALYSLSCNGYIKTEDSVHDTAGAITLNIAMLGFSERSIQEWNNLPFLQNNWSARAAIPKQRSKWPLVSAMPVAHNKISTQYDHIYAACNAIMLLVCHFVHYIFSLYILVHMHMINLLGLMFSIYYSLDSLIITYMW